MRQIPPQTIGRWTAALTDQIQHWLDGMCETPEWDNVEMYAHEELAYDMAKGAMSVLNATANVQAYLEQEGYIQES